MKKPLKRLLSCQKLCQRNIPKKYGSLGAYQHQLLVITRLQNNDFAYAEQKGNLVSLEMLLVYIKLICIVIDNENYMTFIKNKKPITLNVFPTAHRLCNHYPYIKVYFPSFSSYVMMKPSFSFPFIKPPNMIPSIDDNIFEQFTINACKVILK